MPRPRAFAVLSPGGYAVVFADTTSTLTLETLRTASALSRLYTLPEAAILLPGRPDDAGLL